MGNNIVSSLNAGSGIDVPKLVEGLVSVARAAPEQRLDRNQEKLESQISAYGTLKSSMDEFKKVLDPLTNPDLFNARSATFPSNNEFITANGLSPDAQTGTFDVKVVQTARSQSLASASMDSATDQVLTSGDSDETLTINFGAWSDSPATNPGATFSANADKDSLEVKIIAGKSSLNDIAEAINKENKGLQASVIDDGNGKSQLLLTAPSGEKQQVQLQITDTNGAGKLDFMTFDTGMVAGPNAMSQTQAGRDAKVEVNGLEVSRASNTMDDVVKGFDFTLNKESLGEVVTFSIEQDSSTSEQAIRDFVEAYNTFATTAKNLTGITEDEETKKRKSGALSTDGSAKQIVSTITGSRSQQVTGLTGKYSMLANIGIVTEQNGSLKIDEDIFKKALTDNYDDVTQLFSRSTSSSNSSIDVGTKSYKTPPAGSYQVEVTQDPSKANIVSGATAIPANFDASDPAKDYSFKFSFHGQVTSEIKLDQVYTTPEELAAAIQVAINSDKNLENERGVVVNYDSATTKFTFESNEYGTVNNSAIVGFTEISTDMRTLFDMNSSTTATGKDAKGTIDGVEAFGVGNVLLAATDSKADGLSLTITPGAAGSVETINFSSGFAGELVSDLSTFLADKGTISNREERINSNLEKIDEDREKLDTRMSKLQIRYQSQFLAMEAILNGMSNTSKQLDTILDTLPFTAKSN